MTKTSEHLSTEYRVDYDFNQNWSYITRIKIQKKIWPGEWETIKSVPYTGEEQERQFEAEVKRLNEIN